MDVGVEAAFSPSGTQPLTIRLYTIPNAAAMSTVNMTLIGSFPVNLANQSLTVAQVPVWAVVIDPLLVDLVVEVFSPSGLAAGRWFYIGSNNLGQIAPSYISAVDYGIPQPATLSSLGFPNMHTYMAVTGADCPTPSLSQTWGGLKLLYR